MKYINFLNFVWVLKWLKLNLWVQVVRYITGNEDILIRIFGNSIALTVGTLNTSSVDSFT